MTRNAARIIGASMLAMGVLLLCALPLAAQGDSSGTIVNHPVAFAVSPPLRELAKLPQQPVYGFHEVNPVRLIPKPYAGSAVDPVEQSTAGPASNYTVGINVIGVGNGFPGYTVPDAPPDTQMDVGDTQIVQWVNVSYAVFDKATGNPLTGAINGNLIWSSLGGSCATHNSGDIMVLFDRQAHRWFLSQPVFTSPYMTCIAVSTSSDALGTYHLYAYPQGSGLFPDYPKWGVWSNGYYQSSNLFSSSFVRPQPCAYNRAKILLGDPSAEQVCFTNLTGAEDTLQFAHIESPTQPPSGEDAFAIGSVGDVDNSHLSLYSIHVDWSQPQNATITGVGNSQQISIPTFTPACGPGDYSDACVPQLGTADKLDSLGGFLMHPFAYWEDPPPSHAIPTGPPPAPMQHWVIGHDVQVAGGNIGVRWYEFQAPIRSVPVTSLVLFQSGTFAPDSNYRWMDSIARDRVGDMLVGYSESSSSMFPAIAIAGRTNTDPLGTLENEVIVINGTGSQPDTSNRWGDYSAMRIDPTDNCTFWYSTEYYMVTLRFDWSTRINSAKFSNCH
jgi:hypothetical protein